LEGCSETEIIKFEKPRCLQAQFGLGAASGPRDFKSPVSNDRMPSNVADFESTASPIV